ncbi:protocadherin-8 [Denticeps clupeoides]|uniref:Cadherin domain-containing protein n=1 Tax=Denticeps clupeoides TaxID=299321 RepID=A0AAY4DM88_9TELE|nr:protocadherin-8-like [Denticeps clupeoides]
MSLFLESLAVALLVSAARCTTTKYFTYEEDAAGTEIGNLSRDLHVDPAATFRFMQDLDPPVVHMRPTDGLLTVGEVVDREALCRRSAACLVAFDVVAVSGDKFQLVHVEIEVRDVNDHSPRFAENETALEVLENVPVDTRFPLDVAVDQDVGVNYVQKYHISHNSHFAIDVHTREDGAKYAELVLVKSLDRETEDSYSIEVTATDGGSPPRSGTTTVLVKVLDFNDNSPIFEHNSLKVELYEDAPVGSRVLKVHAFDPDAGANGEVVYGLVDAPPSDVSRLFKIDPQSGAVTLKEPVDYEKKRSYELNIRASDLGGSPMRSTCRVAVEILDVNDNPPQIAIKPMTSSSDGVAFITEAAAEESFVALVSTSDRDSGANGYVHTSLLGHRHFRLRQAYGDAYMIVTAAGLDREKIAEYNLTVEAEDLGTPPFKTVRHYTIRVTDENDNAPLFSKSLYEVSVVENNVPGSYVTTVVARDPDAGKNGKVAYRVLEKPLQGDALLSTFVSIDPASGSLYSLRSFDYEALRTIELTVLACDNGVPQQSGTTAVRINIVNQNDNYPHFTHPAMHNGTADVPLPADAPAGFLVLRLRAEDEDEGPAANLGFEILEGDRELFSVARASGEVALRRRLSSRCGEVLEVQIAVSDNGRPALSSAATLRFVVTDTGGPGEQIFVSWGSGGEEEPSLGASTVAIALLGAGCVLLLAAIAGVAVYCRLRLRRGGYASKSRAARGLLGDPSIAIRKASEADSYAGAGLFLCHKNDSGLYDRDGSTEGDSKAFLSSKSFDGTATWHDDRRCIQQSATGNTDQLSVKDSGKGDSDFNDSDSDTSGYGGKRTLSTFQPWAKSSLTSADMPGADWHGRYGVIPTRRVHAAPGTSYTIGFSQEAAYGNSHASPRPWRGSRYGVHVASRTGTLPPYTCHQKREAPRDRDQDAAAASEIATTF